MVLKTAIIIAGGRGTRLEERKEDLPKPLIPINGKPILERILEWLSKSGVKKVIIGVAYKKDMIKNYFGDGSDFGMNIIYTEHDEHGGTGDAFKRAIEQSGIEDEDFYAMNGDQVTDLDLGKFSENHASNNSVATIATINLRTNFGVIDIHEGGKIKAFKEKGEIFDKKMNSGIYIFNKRIKEFINEGNIEENTFKKLVDEEKIHSFHHEGIWLTVNDKKELKYAEEVLKNLENS